MVNLTSVANVIIYIPEIAFKTVSTFPFSIAFITYKSVWLVSKRSTRAILDFSNTWLLVKLEHWSSITSHTESSLIAVSAFCTKIINLWARSTFLLSMVPKMILLALQTPVVAILKSLVLIWLYSTFSNLWNTLLASRSWE